LAFFRGARVTRARRSAPWSRVTRDGRRRDPARHRAERRTSTIQDRQRIIDFVTSHRAPVVSGWLVFARSGAICTYGPRLVESYRRLAYYVDRVLKGAKPADLPIERQTQFELVINLKTAKALGLTVPPSLLVRADEVIE